MSKACPDIASAEANTPGPSVCRTVSDLVRWARPLGVELDAHQMEQFQVYLDTLLLWNRRFALVSQHDPALILTKHFADSLAVASVCAARETAIDLGSGAGLPGIPIAIAHPNTYVRLVESRRKKVSFLAEVIRRAHLRNAAPVEARMERVAHAPQHASRYTLVVFRALPDLPKLLRLARHYLSPGGRALAMKRPEDQHELCLMPLSELGCRLDTVVPYQLPDGTPRALFSFRFT